MMDIAALTSNLKAEAHRLGFPLVGACPAVEPTGVSRLQDWLDSGFDGQMTYLRDRRSAYSHPSHVLAGVRSILMLGMPYRTREPAAAATGTGRVSRYAWGPHDYHDVIHARLKRLGEQLRQFQPEARVRGVVDSAPLLEREFAQLAGLGWIGKNTMLLNTSQGSWFFLAALLTDQPLSYDSPHATDHCGTCRLCLDACPTQAFPAPYTLDATRCISYLTIELRTAVPRALRPGVGDWLFGCDVCQDVCPWNRRAPQGDEQAFGPAEGMNPANLAELFQLDEAAFRARFRHTPLWRPRRRGLLRNAAIVLGNQGDASGVPALVRGLHDEDSLVRGACAWALGRIDDPSAHSALTARLAVETNAEVRQEIERQVTGER
jgi:epoxyqueuosine reductase